MKTYVPSDTNFFIVYKPIPLVLRVIDACQLWVYLIGGCGIGRGRTTTYGCLVMDKYDNNQENACM